MLQLLNESLADLQQAAAAPAPAPPPPSQKPSAGEEAPKWSRENHPAFKKAAVEPAAAEDQQDAAAVPVVYQVNDNVLARWMSGDKGFYPARITSVTGSKTAPIYTVRFKSYDTVETVRGKDIKPVAAAATGAGAGAAEPAAVGGGQKRKAASGDGIVLSAGQELYPHAVEQKRQEAAAAGEGKGKGGDKYDELGRPKFKKIKAKKELEAGKNKWQEFTAKGKGGKTAKKESMFRTPEGPGGRGEFCGGGGGGEVLFGRTCADFLFDSGLYRLGAGHAQGSDEEPPCVPAQRRCGLKKADLAFFYHSDKSTHSFPRGHHPGVGVSRRFFLSAKYSGCETQRPSQRAAHATSYDTAFHALVTWE